MLVGAEFKDHVETGKDLVYEHTVKRFLHTAWQLQSACVRSKTFFQMVSSFFV